MIRQISISEARKTLPLVVEQVYYGDSVIVTKNRIPLVQIVPLTKPVKLSSEKTIPPEAFGLWKDMQGDTLTIASKLRKIAWEGKYAR